MKKTTKSLLSVVVCSLFATGVGAQPPTTPIGKFRSQFTEMQSIYLRARAMVILPDVAGRGLFEYWSDGYRYRVSCRTDDRLGLMSDVEYAFDGLRHQQLLAENDVIEVQEGDKGTLLTAIPNPLFFPVLFLDPGGDCPNCNLTMSHVSDDRHWAERLASSSVVRFDEPTKAGFSVPGSGPAGRDVDYRVELTSAAHGVPARIEMVNEEGISIVTVELTSYEAVPSAPSFLFPQKMKVKAVQGEAEVDIWLQVEAIEVNGRIDDQVFVLDDSEVQGVWDAKAKQFIKGGLRSFWDEE